MKPMDNIPETGMEKNEFQAHRREELRKFWDSEIQFAELDTQGTVSMARERALYQKAASSERIPWYEIKFHKRGEKMYAERLMRQKGDKEE